MRQKGESSLRPLTQLCYTTFNVKLYTNEFTSVLRAPSPPFICSFFPLSHSAYLSEKLGFHVHV